MAVGEFAFPAMPEVAGVRLASVSAGIKNGSNQEDLALIELCEGARVAGVFTRNAFCAAPVIVARDHLATRSANPLADSERRYLIINAGNANACTGKSGITDAVSTCAAVGDLATVNRQHVLPFSTGVIGEPLPVERIVNALADLYKGLSAQRWRDAAKAIMTTDTRPKGACVTFEHEGETITVNGIAKGAGMIKPDMATMLAYVFTNAKIAPSVVELLLRQAVEKSFNRITVDGDTSTNDACILAATGRTALAEITEASGDLYAKLFNAVVDVHIQLAQNIVCDGEGATKFVTVEVHGGASDQECLDVAYSVAESPLVKTALFACDPNWGRIVMAIGKAGIVDLDVDNISVWLNSVLIVENGGRAASYTEDQGQSVMRQSAISIRIELGRGSHSERVWTTDLSHEYVSINAEYRS
ncbi:MAG: bifunctional glutamate N-acetyltransferase/amino-acid acetyltransferase ArgJ [Exilibacterium sp.]